MKKYVLALGGSFLFALSSLAIASEVAVFNNSSSGVCAFYEQTTPIAPHHKTVITAESSVEIYTGDCYTGTFVKSCPNDSNTLKKVIIQGKEDNLRVKCLS